LQRIAERLEAQPSKSLPQILGTVAEREATYRFLSNENISFGGILEPHFEATALRTSVHAEALCVHDTTELEFKTPAPRRGLGHLRGVRSAQGFRAHVSLSVTFGESAEPLGLLSVKAWTRTTQVRQMRRKAGKKEMDIWFDGVDQSNSRCPEVSLIHVMDRQADSYELL
jgi:hypothetical protein